MRHCATAFATGFTRVRRLFERPVQRYPALNRLFCSRLSGPCLSQAHSEQASSTHTLTAALFAPFETSPRLTRTAGRPGHLHASNPARPRSFVR
jgi:hypothetical protein